MTDEADVLARARRKALAERRWDSATASAPSPTIDAEWLCRQMGRRDLTGAGLANILQVTPTAVSQWLEGRPIPAKRQRELMDLFGEPLNLRDATLEELMSEVFRRFTTSVVPPHDV